MPVKRLGEGAAEKLAAWQGKSLYLADVEELDEADARGLSSWGGEVLVLNEVSKISLEGAEYLSQWSGRELHVYNLYTADKPIREALKKFQGKLTLPEF